MLYKNDNRKVILQQLLEKSQLFNNYFQTQMIQNPQIMLLLSNKKAQTIQFGKCEINLPDKTKVNNAAQKFNRKVMILSKGKGKQKQSKQKNIKSVQSQRKQVLQNMQNLKSRNKNIQLQLNIGMQSERKSSVNQRISQSIKDMDKQNCTQGTQFSKSVIILNQSVIDDQKAGSAMVEQFCGEERLIKQRINIVPSHKMSQQFEKKQDQKNQQRHYQVPTSGSNPNVNAKSRIFSAKIERRQQTPEQFTQKSIQKLQPHQHCQSRRPIDSHMSSQRKTQYELFQRKQQNSSSNLHQNHNNANYYGNLTPSLVSTPSRQSYHGSINSSTFQVKKYQSLLSKNYQQKMQEEKKAKITTRKQVHKIYNRAFVPPPKITAQSYCVYEMGRRSKSLNQAGSNQNQTNYSGKILVTSNGKNSQEVASLTKIMTCIIVLEISSRIRLNLQEEIIEIGKFQSTIGGTSARIAPGELYTVKDLLHGLMLPSGNDASLALGVWGGRQLIQNSNSFENKNISEATNDQSCSSSPISKKVLKKQAIARFLEQMNKKAAQLSMTKTNYANTHGLINPQNKSSAIDIAFLSEYAMNNPTFCSIVSTKLYKTTIKYKQLSNQGNTTRICPTVIKQKQVSWQNTHRLLQRKPNEYIGIKTGVTTVAGPCLSSCVFHKESGRKFIIVVLGCSKMLGRFKETEVLKKWLYKQENLKTSNGNKKKFKPRTCSLNVQNNQQFSSQKGDETSGSEDEDLDGEVEGDELD